MSAKDIFLKAVNTKLERVINTFSDALVTDEEHPLITGITSGNWQPSVGHPVLREDWYGFSKDDVLDAMSSNTRLIDLSTAKYTARNNDWKLGDELFWTNSLEHIGELETRRKFFDQIVANATIEAQRAAKGGIR